MNFKVEPFGTEVHQEKLNPTEFTKNLKLLIHLKPAVMIRNRMFLLKLEMTQVCHILQKWHVWKVVFSWLAESDVVIIMKDVGTVFANVFFQGASYNIKGEVGVWLMPL